MILVVILTAIAVLSLVNFAFGEDAARGLAQTLVALLGLAVAGVIIMIVMATQGS